MIKRLVYALCIVGSAHGMVFDNRYMPLLLKPFYRHTDAPFHQEFQAFFINADRAFSDGFPLSIPDIEGIYDQRVLAQGLTNVGFSDPLRSDFRLRTTIPWGRTGRLDVQGLAYHWEVPLGSWAFLGANCFFAHVSMRHEFFLTGADEQLPAGDIEYLYQVKERMHKDLKVTSALFSKTGLSDIDLYLRWYHEWEYVLKSRRLAAGVKFGTYIPSGVKRDVDNPASIPFGGNGHWGVYGDFQGTWELKEDLTAALMVRAIKRFEKTEVMRMPLLNEPVQYGILKGPVTVNPGWTFVFNPSVDIAHLRAGLGVKILYTLVAHLRDEFHDRRSLEQRERFPSHIPAEFSSWGAEHVTIGAYYDFDSVSECNPLYPKISAYWDIPVDWLVSKRSTRTSCVSLMVGLDF